MQALVVTLIAGTLRLLAAVSPRLAGRFAFFLFCRPTRRAKVRPDEQEIHARARTESIEVGGKSVVVYHWGDGPNPVLLVHGWEDRGSGFARFVEALTDRGLSAITFDAPGHGDSPGNGTDILEYEAIMHRLYTEHGPFHAVIAHSFGALGTFQGLRSGVKAGRVVTINGICDFGYLADTFSGRLSMTPKVKHDIRVRTERRLGSPGMDIWRMFSVSYNPAAVAVPILVVQDDDDRTVDPGQARRIVAAHQPHARLMTTAGWGHRRTLRNPAVIEATMDFLVGEHVV